MKTPATAQNLAIKALAESIAATLVEMQAVGEQARESSEIGELNGTVGALMHVQSRVASLSAQLEAVMQLHRTK